MQLPISNSETFNGDYNKWIEIRDCSQAIVGKNATLSGVQKLCHLRKCLNSDVLKTIESLSLTDANYEVAWQALSKRYEKGKRIVETHVRKIINFPCLTKESSKDLRNLYDTVNDNLQALQILNQPVDTWDAILVPIITDKLDQKSKREYEVFYIQEMDRNPSDNSSPSIKSLLDIIKKSCDLLERLEKDKSESIRPAIKTTRNDYKYQSTSSSHLNTRTFSCYFCKRDHTIYKCIEFLELSVPNRIQEIKRLKFCLNCLRPHDSSITKCLAIKCRKCNRAHNTLLHLEKYVNTATLEETANDSNKNNASPDIQTTPETASFSALVRSRADDNNREKGVSLVISSQVLSSTAIIFVQDCHGVGQVSSTIGFKTNVTISARDNTLQAKLSCLILTHITSNIPQITFTSNYLELPNNVNLADPDFNISRPIDMLLGAGIFWELINSEKIRIKNSRLVLQSFKLGWVPACLRQKRIIALLGNQRVCRDSLSLWQRNAKNACQAPHEFSW
ncbi:hypothetical protein JTB14_029983 [Gonioctena quinquepunctata]|nr:hypothetical protein JTB14_029983 [Gonioctena quinquepunctata]